jgi:hypothetical protein
MFLASHAGRFVSGLTLSSPDCSSCTVIHSCVLGGQRAQLHGDLVYGVSLERDMQFLREDL